MKDKKLGGRIWLNMILFGFMGQVAWAVENMFFNTFLYNSVYNGASQIAVNGSIDVMAAIRYMVAFSAATAVITTFLVGAWSDKIGKRKIFISLGYVLWGIVTGAFGFISRDNTAKLFGLTDEIRILTVTVSIVIVMDCVMTFMGSTSNDAAFNAWVTDITSTNNRATVESVLALLPVVAMGAVMGLGGVAANNYSAFFIGLGAVVSLCGIIGIFTLKDSGDGVKKEAPYIKELFYGFKPSVIKGNSRLYLSLAAVAVFNIAFQVFFPYIFIYISNNKNFSLDEFVKGLTPAVIAVAGVAVIAVVVLLIVMGRIIDKYGKEKFIFVSIALFIIGLIIMWKNDSNIAMFIVGAIPMLAGYGLLMVMLNSTVRDFTPEDKAGLFQGVRMIFQVLLPMVIGPAIGDLICKVSSITYINDYNVEQRAPGAVMFVAAAVVALFIIVPIIPIMKKGFRPTVENDQ